MWNAVSYPRHDEIVEKVQKEMPSEDTLYDLTELFLDLRRFHPDTDFVRTV